MTKEPQEEINRLMNEKLNADKMSLNPPLKFEPQEETYQTLENKALEELEIFLEKWDGHENDLKDFLKSHLKEAYEAGQEDNENIATPQYKKDMQDAYEDGIAEERERTGKELTEELTNYLN